jgi:hypothetical protein
VLLDALLLESVVDPPPALLPASLPLELFSPLPALDAEPSLALLLLSVLAGALSDFADAA